MIDKSMKKKIHGLVDEKGTTPCSIAVVSTAVAH